MFADAESVRKLCESIQDLLEVVRDINHRLSELELKSGLDALKFLPNGDLMDERKERE
jgi:hypothetical protein